MKAALFLVLFILFSSFRHDIHYFFHSSERERDIRTQSLPYTKAAFAPAEVGIKPELLEILIYFCRILTNI